MNIVRLLYPILLLLALPAVVSAQPRGQFQYEDDDVIIIIGARTPEQLAAFYTGRGFNQASIDAITSTCFVFGMIENKTYDALWLDLDDWQFVSADGDPITRISLDDWKKTWKKTGL